MSLSQFFTIFITLHAIAGGISLIAGTISVIAKKGGKLHKKSGKVFFYGMMVAGLSGIGASVIPNHYNPFLFVVGLFSVYLVLSGYRALGFTRVRDRKSLRLDIGLAWAMLIIGLAMIGFGLFIALEKHKIIDLTTIGIILIVFGLIGGLNGYNDLRVFRDLKTLRKKAIRMHIGKITGGYIAAFTAFLVVNDVLPSIMSWLLPTAFGLIFITYWQRKVSPKSKKRQSLQE